MKKLIVLIFFPVFLWCSQRQIAPVIPTISFDEFINPGGNIQKACAAKRTTPEKYTTLLSFFHKGGLFYRLYITDIPVWNSTIEIRIDRNCNCMTFSQPHENIENCLMATFYDKTMCAIYLTHLQALSHVIHGNTVMQLWEAFCSCCAFQKAEIRDGAKCAYFELRKLLPYITGTTWYGKFGYVPELVDHEYIQQQTRKLTGRSVIQMLGDFSEKKVVRDALYFACDITCLNPQEITFGQLVTELYAAYRDTAHPLYEQANIALICLYKNCMDDYTAKCDDQFRITNIQREIFESWRKIVKSYHH